MSDRNGFALLVIALSLSIAPAVNGEPAPAPPDRSLATALATARPPDTGVAISVDAGNVPLTERVKLPAPGSPIGTIADAYGRINRPFGTVQAIAPPTMTILNTNPNAPNLYQDMSPSDVFRLLALSLNPMQWGQLTSPQGLGIDDLDDKQRLMFEALFPGESLQIAPRANPGPAHLPLLPLPHVQTVSADQLLQSRLCLSQKVQMMLPVVGKKDAFEGPDMPPGANDPQVFMALPSPPKTVGGVSIKAAVPNVPKRSNLDYKAALFRTAIPLSGLKTVGDLVARIARQTRTELYADARLENLPLTIVGQDRSARAADLLPALAFCVTGTFRNVGPAFVLTDDLVGLGTRRMILEAFFDSFNQQRGKLVGPSNSLSRAHPLADVPLSANSLAISPDELKQAATDSQRANNVGVQISLPFEQLTPEQQTYAQAMLNASEAEQQADEKNGYLAAHPDQVQHLSLDGKIMLFTTPLLQLHVPGLDGVVSLDYTMGVRTLFMSQGSLSYSRAPALPTPQPSGLEIMKRYARRAVLVQPRTLEQLDSIIAAMPAADLNELWLIVPNPGEAVPDGSSAPGAGALVDEALKKAGPAHIRVLPVLSLFFWGDTAPSADLDYTIVGENSAQVEKRDALEFERQHPGLGYLWPGPLAGQREAVSPFVPSVETALNSFLKMVVRPGIAGMAWQNPTVPGYEPPEDPYGNGWSDHIPFPHVGEPDYGYTIEGRLRFLREEHTDPIDIGPVGYGDIDMSLPFFNDSESAYLLLGEWYKLRASVELKVIQQLYATAQGMAAANNQASFAGLPVLIPRGQDNYGSWDDQNRLPSLTTYSGVGTLEDMAARERRSSRILIGVVSGYELREPSRIVSDLLNASGAHGWDGVLFDLSPTTARPGAAAQSSLDLLTRLTANLHFEHSAAP